MEENTKQAEPAGQMDGTNPDSAPQAQRHTDLEGGKTTEKEPVDEASKDGGDGTQDPEPGTGTEKKGPESKKEDGKKKENETDKDEYGEFELPKEVNIAKEEMASFKTLAKQLGLSKENAQKLVSLQASMAIKAAQAQQEEFAKFQEELKAKCAEKFGDRLDDLRTAAAKALDRFGGEELRKVLDDFGMGNHPVLVEAFAKIGREISEDRAVLAKTQATQDITAAQALYGKK